MSYHRQSKNDSLLEYVLTWTDFNKASRHLRKSVSEKDTFIIWLEKCITIDKRLTFLHFKNNKEAYPKECLEIAQKYFKKTI